ncbi:hypothetical protein TRIUR3_22927 [Triticum urartu]|uniref:Uncharacterized protein n=1 Tax=Triticum urartu TaxID=4572 RepID=M7ZG51_TRIUA|nr:hypothetical protein TRIUR3_22927 [Triticum urartu]
MGYGMKGPGHLGMDATEATIWTPPPGAGQGTFREVEAEHQSLEYFYQQPRDSHALGPGHVQGCGKDSDCGSSEAGSYESVHHHEHPGDGEGDDADDLDAEAKGEGEGEDEGEDKLCEESEFVEGFVEDEDEEPEVDLAEYRMLRLTRECFRTPRSVRLPCWDQDSFELGIGIGSRL